MDANQRTTERHSAFEVAFFEIFVAALDAGGGFGLQGLQQTEELPGVKGFQGVIRQFAGSASGSADHNDRNFGMDGFEGSDQCVALHVRKARVGDDAVHSREAFQRVNGFLAAIGGDDVELCGFNDEFSRGDSARRLPIDDEKTGPVHAIHYEGLRTNPL